MIILKLIFISAAEVQDKHFSHLNTRAERLGHSSVSITMDMYSHLSQDIQQKAADDLSKLIG